MDKNIRRCNKHGYNAASSLNAVVLDSQDESKKKDAVKLSIKHIRNQQQKTEQLLIDIINYMPSFIELVENTIHIINIAMSAQDREGILRNFDINEEMLNEGEFDRYDYYFIKHYDPSKKYRIRWCPISARNLAYVNVLDYRYYHYQEVIKRYTNNNTDNNNNSLSIKNQKLQLLVSAYKILEELGFKTNYIHDKIKSNVYASIHNPRVNFNRL